MEDRRRDEEAITVRLTRGNFTKKTVRFGSHFIFLPKITFCSSTKAPLIFFCCNFGFGFFTYFFVSIGRHFVFRTLFHYMSDNKSLLNFRRKKAPRFSLGIFNQSS